MTPPSPPDATWPSVIRETRSWRTNPDQRGSNGLRPDRLDRMFTETTVEIPARIAALPVPAATADVLARNDAAVAAIASLEGRADHLAGLDGLLARTEAVASSRIERVYADLDDVARASIGEEAGETARSTVAAMRALRALSEACGLTSPLDEPKILAAHAALMGQDRLESEFAGRWRTQQNWIGGSDTSPRGAVHVPPPPELVPELVKDLVRFAERRDLPALVHAAIAHAQFEAIHPFTDGNGRIGRAIIGAILRYRGLTVGATVPVAAAMLADVDTYFDALADYRSGDIGPNVDLTVAAAATAAACAAESADRLAALPEQWRTAAGVRRGASALSIIDGLLRQPILDVSRAVELTGATPRRTYVALDLLVEAGVLDEITGGRRSRIWVAADVMAELEQLERQIGVRQRPSQRYR